MSIHYCFIAKDSDMIVFENLVNKAMQDNLSQLKNESEALLVQKERDAVESRQEYSCVTLEKITGSVSVECHLMFKTVFFGCVTDLKYDSEKA